MVLENGPNPHKLDIFLLQLPINFKKSLLPEEIHPLEEYTPFSQTGKN